MDNHLTCTWPFPAVLVTRAGQYSRTLCAPEPSTSTKSPGLRVISILAVTESHVGVAFEGVFVAVFADVDFDVAGVDFAVAGVDFDVAGVDFAVAGVDFVEDFVIAGVDFAIAGAEFAVAGVDFAAAVEDFVAGVDFVVVALEVVDVAVRPFFLC